MTVEINYRFLLRSGTAAQAVTANEVLLENEIGYEADTGKLKIGDGATAWLSLPYFTVLDTVLRARLATAAALPANTYSNGSSGVGATLTLTATGTLTVDGIVTALDDVIVVGSESTKSHNGVYRVTTAGASGVAAVLTRSTRFDAPDEIPGRLITVGPEGTANASQTLLCTTAASPTVGTTNITFAPLGGNGGAGGDTFAIASGADTITAVFSPVPSLVDGLQFKVRAAAANATTTPTFNPNSLGALTIYKLGGVAMAAGDISGAGHELILRYRASPARYELANPAGVQQPVGGSHINVDATDPRKPVIAVTGLSAGAGYAEGVSFPASPGLNDKFYRNDLNLLCYYDGTRWLTTTEYQTAGQVADSTTGTTVTVRWAVRSDFATYLTRWIATVYATSSGTTTATLSARSATNASTTLATFSTSGDAATNWVNHDQAINSVLPSGTKLVMQTLSGGSVFYPIASLAFRLVIT